MRWFNTSTLGQRIAYTNIREFKSDQIAFILSFLILAMLRNHLSFFKWLVRTIYDFCMISENQI